MNKQEDGFEKLYAICGLFSVAGINTPILWAVSDTHTTIVWQVTAFITTGLGMIGFIFKGKK